MEDVKNSSELKKDNSGSTDNISTNTDSNNTDAKIDRPLTNIEKYRLTISKEQARENSIKGAMISAEKRREKRTLREGILKRLEDDATYNAILDALINGCIEGNAKSFELLRDTAGEKPRNEIDVTADIITDADRALIEKALKR